MRRYRVRKAQETALYRLVEAHYEAVKGQWEDRFERCCGRWRGFVDGVVNRFLDCGVYESGCARVRCPECAREYLVAFSCQTRTFCPSFAAKRSAVFAAFLSEEVLAEVGHWMMTFTVPKMLRPYFLHHRELLGKLSRAAWESVRELMAEAVGEEGFQTGIVVAVHSAGDFLGWHPHAHAVVPRGGWVACGEWVPVPYLDALAAERLFRHKVLSFLKQEGLLSEERIELLLSWRHSGFSVDMSVKVEPEDENAVERVARYILRPPLSLERLTWNGQEVRYRGKDRAREERFDPLDFVARLLMHAPEPRLHTARYYGAYSSVARARAEGLVSGAEGADREPSSAERRRLRRSWARMLARIYEVDPLLCECGAEMKVIACITDHRVIRKILDHVRRCETPRERGPPPD